MFEASTGQVNDALQIRKDANYNNMRKSQENRVKRFLDMQNVLAGSLAGPQQAVNNAENYPSTWTTNPDGGANEQVQ